MRDRIERIKTPGCRSVMSGSTRTKSTDCMTRVIFHCANRSDGNPNGASFLGNFKISTPAGFHKRDKDQPLPLDLSATCEALRTPNATLDTVARRLA